MENLKEFKAYLRMRGYQFMNAECTQTGFWAFVKKPKVRHFTQVTEGNSFGQRVRLSYKDALDPMVAEVFDWEFEGEVVISVSSYKGLKVKLANYLGNWYAVSNTGERLVAAPEVFHADIEAELDAKASIDEYLKANCIY